MRIIEICGPPCSGKTFIHDFLIKRFKKKFISSNQLIYENAHLYLNLSFIEKISLFYFQMIKINYLKNIGLRATNYIKMKLKKIQDKIQFFIKFFS